MPCWEARPAWPVAQDALKRTIHALLGVLTVRVLEQALARRLKPVPLFGQNQSGALMKIEYAVMSGKLRCAVCCSLLLWLAAACGGVERYCRQSQPTFVAEHKLHADPHGCAR